MKISTFLLVAFILSPVAAAPGEEGIADPAAMDMSMPAVENAAAGQEAGKDAPAKDGGKGGKDDGKDTAVVAVAGDAAAAPNQTVTTEATNTTSDAPGNSTDALSESSASGVDLYFAMKTLGVAAVVAGLWF